MSTVQGVINKTQTQTLQGVPGSAGGPSNWSTPGYIRGTPKVMVDYYVALGTETTGTVLKMHPLLDVGVMILYHVFIVGTSEATITMSVGDLDSATRYVSASSNAQTAGAYLVAPAISSTGPYIIGTNPTTATATDTDAQITMTTGAATMTVSVVYGLETYFVAA